MQSQLPNYMSRTDLAQDMSAGNVHTRVADKQLDDTSPGDYNFPFKTLNSIEGIPYQFMGSVDRRITNKGQEFGRKYSQKILSQLPVLFMMPCRPQFMPGYNSSSKENVLLALVEDAGDRVNEFLEKTSKKLVTSVGGMYYSVEFAYDEYYNYLNQMVKSVAGYMGLADETINLLGKGAAGREAIKNINWGGITKLSENDKIFSSAESIAFFVDGLNSIDTSFSNDTRPSSLAGTVNGYSDMANEVAFLIGNDRKGKLDLTDAVDFTKDIANGVGEAASSLLGGFAGGLLDSLASNGPETILNGGKIIFPEIWSDSEHSESYSFTVKLRSPDHDSLSILLNILVPYCKILAMTMPKTIDGNPNGYKSPFLVKAYCKGLFSIDMGIIDSLQVTKGAECMWNDDGLPTQIDISFSIKNLYNSLAMVGANDDITELIANTSYMDFLANMAGCNVMKSNYEFQGQIRRTMYELRNRISLGNNIDKVFNTISTDISNALGRLYGYI